MLSITRKLDESLIINGNIEVMVIDIRGNGKVRLGITAPRDVSVHRKEIQEQIDREKNISACPEDLL